MRLANNRSFTLIELVSIFLVLSILAAVAISQTPDMLDLRINQAAAKMQSDIRFAQRLAMQLQRRVAILFDPVAESYSIHIENTYLANDWSINVRAQNPLTREDFVVQLNSEEFQDVEITATLFNGANWPLVFDRNGDPYAMRLAPFAILPLVDPAGIALNFPTNSKFILVRQATGSVNVQDTFP